MSSGEDDLGEIQAWNSKNSSNNDSGAICGSGGGGPGPRGVDGDALAARLREEAFERVRAAFPAASVEQRMFHRLANVSSQPEGADGRRRRVGPDDLHFLL